MIENSNTIKEKFTDTIPSKYASLIEKEKLSMKFRKTKMTWSDYRDYARHMEVEIKSKSQKAEKAKEKEQIIINIENDRQTDNWKNQGMNGPRIREDENKFNSWSGGRSFENSHRNQDRGERDFNANNYKDRGNWRGGRGFRGQSRGNYDNRDQGNRNYDSRDQGNRNCDSRDKGKRNYDSRDQGRENYDSRDHGRGNYDNRDQARGAYRGGRNYQQESNPCNHCQRFGHNEENCRIRLKQCIICGGADHRRTDCPNKREMKPHSQKDKGQFNQTNRNHRNSRSNE